MTKARFRLVTQCGQPVAAIVDDPIDLKHLQLIYQLLPARSIMHPEVAKRHGVWGVISPMDVLKPIFGQGRLPEGIHMAFL